MKARAQSVQKQMEAHAVENGDIKTFYNSCSKTFNVRKVEGITYHRTSKR